MNLSYRLRQGLQRAWNSKLLTTWLLQVTRILRFALLTPLILTAFSAEEVAVWYLLLTIQTFSQLFDLGLAPTFIRYFSFAFGGGKDFDSFVPSTKVKTSSTPNWPLVGRVFSASGVLFAAIAVGSLLLLGILGTLALLRPVSELSRPLEGWLSWVLVLGAIAIVLYGKRYQVYLMGVGQIALSNRLNAVFSMLSIAAGAITILTTKSLPATVAALEVFALLGVLRGYVLSRRVEAGRARAFQSLSLDWPLIQHMFSPAWRVSISGMASLGLTQMSGLLLAQFAAPSVVASYLLAQRTLLFGGQFLSAPVVAIQPLLPKLRAQGELSAIRRMMTGRMFASLSALPIVLFPVGFLAPDILNLIGSSVAWLSIDLWLLLVAFTVYERFNFFMINLYNSTNHIRFYKHHAAALVVGLGLILVFAPSYGVAALVLSIGLSRLLIFNIQPAVAAARSIEAAPLRFAAKTCGVGLLVTTGYLIAGFSSRIQ